jgi:hypothetical protein
MQSSNYIHHLLDDDLIRSKHVVEETTILHDNVAHHQSTNMTRINICSFHLKRFWIYLNIKVNRRKHNF